MMCVYRLRKLLLVGAMMLSSVTAYSQNRSDIYAVKSNQYIEVKLGIRDDPDQQLTGIAGRYSFGTIEGDPEIVEDNMQQLTYDHAITPHDVWSWAIISVPDAGNYLGVFGDSANGAWVLEPYVASPDRGQYISASYRTSSGNIRADARFDVCRDMVRQTFIFTNQDTAAHQVGLRLSWDETGPSSCYTSPFVPGYGIVPGETDLRGMAVPDYIDHLDVVYDPVVISRQIFRGMDVTTPDRVVIGERWYMQTSLWDYTIVPDRPPEDTYTYAYWNPVLVGPSQSRKIVVYFGVGVATSDLREPYVLSVQAPRALKYDASMSQGMSPNSFTINAYLYNMYPDVDLTNCSFYLSLPTGLSLKAGEPAQTVPFIYRQEAYTREGKPNEGKVSWEVEPTGDVAGEVTFSITTTGAGIMSKTVSRSIVLPATRTTNLRADWQMVSVPFALTDPTPEAVFQPPAGITLTLYQWNAAINDYDVVRTLSPGKGFWLRSSAAWQMTIAGATPLAGNTTYAIDIRRGWNQFGNPYIYNIAWGRVKVLDERSGLGEISIDEATRLGWIKPTLYWYDVNKRAYERSSDRRTQLVPWRGYWIKAGRNCKLIIPTVDQIGGGIVIPPSPSSPSAAPARRKG